MVKTLLERQSRNGHGIHGLTGEGKRPKVASLLPAAEARKPAPAEEAIRTRAYELYTQRCTCGYEGSACSDWEQAERELRGEAEPNA